MRFLFIVKAPQTRIRSGISGGSYRFPSPRFSTARTNLHHLFSQTNRLKASILETQRIRPGIFALGKHAGEDFEFEGYRVPAGTDVLHVNTLGHFLEEVYEEPFRFKPERFLEQDKFAPKTFGLFGGGPHVCLGRNHSLMQTPVAVAQAIRNYNVVFEEPPEKRE